MICPENPALDHQLYSPAAVTRMDTHFRISEALQRLHALKTQIHRRTPLLPIDSVLHLEGLYIEFSEVQTSVSIIDRPLGLVNWVASQDYTRRVQSGSRMASGPPGPGHTHDTYRTPDPELDFHE
jgi:hypothetical protein